MIMKTVSRLILVMLRYYAYSEGAERAEREFSVLYETFADFVEELEYLKTEPILNKT